MAGTLIQPLKINRPSGRAVPQLNIAADFGVERNVASKLEELFQKKQKQDLIQAETFGQQFAASMSKMILDRDNQGKINKKLFHNFDSYNSLESEIKANIEQFKKDGKELGIDDSILEKYSSMVTGELEKSNVNYLVEYNDYNEKIQKDEANRIIRMKGDNLSSVAMLGDYQGAVQGFYNVAQDLDRAIEAGYIDIEKGINLATKQRQNIIVSYVSSLVNTPDGKSKLQNMDTWNTTQFMEAFQDLNFKNDMGEFYLTVDDFEKFRTTVKSGLIKIQNKENTNKIKTKVDEMKYEQEKKEKYLEIALDEDQIPAGADIPESTLVKATFYKNGLNSEDGAPTTISELIDDGYQVAWKQKKLNDTTEIYKDPNRPGEGIMNFRKEEAYKLAGGYGEKGINNYYDTTDTEIVGGSLFIQGYDTNLEVKELYDNLYSSNNKKRIYGFSEISATDFSDLKEYRTEKVNYNGENTKLKIAESGAKLAGIEMAGRNGDIKANRLQSDINRIATDIAATSLFDETNGIITKDVIKYADRGGVELNENTIGNSLDSLDKKAKRAVLLGYMDKEDDVKDKITDAVDKIIEAATNSYSAVDIRKPSFASKIGVDFLDDKRGVLFLPKGIDPFKINGVINNFIETQPLYVPTRKDGEIKMLEVRKKNVTVLNEIGSNKIFLMYKGANVTDENGVPIYLEVNNDK